MTIVNDHGMLMVHQETKDDPDVESIQTCLGFLWDAKGHGVFDATLGKVDVSPEDAEIHNKLLSEAMIHGLTHTCEIGQGNWFYVGERISDVPGERGWEVTTFIGEVAAGVRETRKVGRVITFTRGDYTFRGSMHKRDDCVFFKRIK